MYVIPAIDLLDGNVVRLQKGDYDKVTKYTQTPLEQATVYAEAGFKRIHIVDLNGAREGSFVNLTIIREIVDQLNIEVQTGGGIRSFDNAKTLFDQGISRIICSSMAVKNKAEWLKTLDHYGERAILGLDLKDGQLAFGGWLDTREISFETFLGEMKEHGLAEILMTDIARDGMLSGPNIALYKHFMADFPELRFIASGGVSGPADLSDLSAAGLHAVVVGRAYYEDHLTLEDMMAVHELG